MSRVRERVSRALVRWSALLVAALVWEVVARRAGSFYFPALSDILRTTWEVWIAGLWTDGWSASAIRRDLVPSLIRALGGLGIALVLGLAIGGVIGLSQRIGSMFEPVIHYLRGMPPVAIVPIFVIVLGIGDQMKMAVIAFGCAWPIVLNTIHGVRSVDPVQLDTAKVFGVSGWSRVRRIVLPAASPSIFAGLKISVAVALILMIVAEMVAGGVGGIGDRIMLAQRNFRVVDMWAGIVVVGTLGYWMNNVFESVEGRVLSWHRQAMQGARR